MRLGARIFKTGLAVTLSLYAAALLGHDTIAYAGLAAFFAVQPSVHKSITLIWDQIQANILSAVLAVVFVLAFGHEPFVIGVVVLLIIAINLRMNKESIIPLAVVTAIIIMGNPTDDFTGLAVNRFLLVMVGVFSAFVVNLIFLPPKHENQLYHKVTSTNDEIIQWIRLLIHHEVDYQTLKQDQKRSSDALLKVENLFELYKDERNIFRKNEYARLRKVVLFRQMITASKQAQHILESLSKHDNVIHQLPETMHEALVAQLDYLTNYHERILLKYMGKVKPQTTEEYYEEITDEKRNLVSMFLNSRDHKQFDEEEWMTFLPVIALIIEYSDELEHLDRLVEGFYTYHTDDNEVYITEKETY
ncbi:FUSC family protein [Salisediminibacterium halotolerans]|uniref:FUSC family protein n=1 Tax=Salisediminibacterium halotolerans TaxID=517425 RepID=UPI000EB27909|nr:aromatic acid exporter family protein [Salisediminibacterium halotolerans]RLJ69227.1 uncharacterized membrane protein YgaE (UPF0421/DUF939 family) [Actinophytocola xinjiangensis]RPE87038.1 uncharacterized membrane protein YgaE (UPF0421/DUF939 family) [Salisediminibacterium halotolerans]TWG32229.1 uncharacterized membrane protein YgaE (UPF0421/DUF939 family) [Salisediminibacterium halotolerans]GEL08778.1 lipoprotein [Salisediminibacterium halotolerans]